jgi:hypothetical protein
MGETEPLVVNILEMHSQWLRGERLQEASLPLLLMSLAQAVRNQHRPPAQFHAGSLKQFLNIAQSPLISVNIDFCTGFSFHFLRWASVLDHTERSCRLSGIVPAAKHFLHMCKSKKTTRELLLEISILNSINKHINNRAFHNTLFK